jgi:hypothetical protein
VKLVTHFVFVACGLPFSLPTASAQVTFSLPCNPTIGAGQDCTALAEFDGDAFLDAAFGSISTNQVRVVFNNGFGCFSMRDCPLPHATAFSPYCAVEVGGDKKDSDHE